MSVTVGGIVFETSADGSIYGKFKDGDAPNGGGPTSEPNLFSDGFEDGTLESNTIRNVPLNTIDFEWESPNRTSLVTMEPQLYPLNCTGGANSGDPTAIYNGALICNGPQSPAGGGDWLADTGDVSLRFRFPGEPAQIGSGETLAENRFKWPLANGQTDFWIRYRIRVPINYVNDLTNQNSKFLALWMNEYNAVGAGVVWNIRPKSDTGAVLTVIPVDGDMIPTVGGNSETTLGDLIDVPADRGKWITMAMQFVAATSNVSNDGIIRTYHMKDGETSFTAFADLTGLNTFVAGGLTGIRGGFLLGSHRGYQDDTEWLVDTVEISDGSLI